MPLRPDCHHSPWAPHGGLSMHRQMQLRSLTEAPGARISIPGGQVSLTRSTSSRWKGEQNPVQPRSGSDVPSASCPQQPATSLGAPSGSP